MKRVVVLKPFLLLVIFLWTFACSEKKTSKEVKEIKAGGNIAEIIRNPVTADGNEDTIHVPKMVFEEKIIHFGTVKEGEIVSREFHFVNEGKVPLLINDCRSTCGCTVPECPRKQIMPGEKGTIKVQFNTSGRKYEQDRPITILANTYPKNNVVRLQGYVEP